MLLEVNSLEIMIKTLSNFNTRIMETITHQIHSVSSFMVVKHHHGNKIQDLSLLNLIQLIMYQQRLQVLNLVLVKLILELLSEVVSQQLKPFLTVLIVGLQQIPFLRVI